MVAKINADTSGGLKITSDTSGTLEIQSAGTTKFTVNSAGVDIPAIGTIDGLTSINGGQVGGRRNIVYNGEMKVAQRSASVAGLGAAAGYFTLDRWKIDTANSAGRLTMTQTADGPNGFANCIKLDCTTADTSLAASEHLIISQRFEGQDLQSIGKGAAGAKEVTVSFYVKANAAFTFGLELYDADNTRQITKLYTTTTAWVRHKITFPADTTGVFTDDNLESLQLGFWLHAGATFASGTLNTAAWADNTNANRAAGIDSFYSSTDNNFFITGVQLEIGSTATEFEHRSYGEELALCQRYCVAWTFSGSYSNIVAAMATASGSVAIGDLILPVTHRVKPTGIVYSGDGVTSITSAYGVGGAGTLAIGAYSNPHSLNLRLNSTSGLTAGHATKIACSGSGDLYTTGGEL
jgi:hypothetical protein